MKLEYLANGSPDCPLIRLYDFTANDAQQLHVALLTLASGSAREVSLTNFLRVELVGGCHLTLLVDKRDKGIVFKASPTDFECAFTETTWDDVAWWVEPFIHDRSGYQWLAYGDINLLISGDGQW